MSFKKSTGGALNSEFAIRYSRDNGNAPRLSPIGLDLFLSDPTKSNTKLDTMAFIIHCPEHDTVAIYEDPGTGIRWLPFTPLCQNKLWNDSATLGALLVLSTTEEQYFSLKKNPPFGKVKMLDMLRIQQPQTLNFLTRMIFYVRLTAATETSHFSCCSAGNCIAWITTTDLCENNLPNIWGPEVVQFMRIVKADFEGYTERIEEFSLDDVYFYSPRDPPRNAEETMLLELGISEKTIEVLYNDFLDHVYPCFSLPIYSFKKYLVKYGLKLDDDRLDSLFMAFNYMKTGYVSFHELLMGLVSLEPLAGHQETRIKFIFRFYDTTSKSYLDGDDFAKLIADMYPNLEGTEQKQAKVEECSDTVEWTMKAVEEGEEPIKVLTFANFRDAIASFKLRGTSRLCRSNVPVFLQLTKAVIRKKKPAADDLSEWKDLRSVMLPRTYKGTCKNCKLKKFRLASNAISLDKHGYWCGEVRTVPEENSRSKQTPIERSLELTFNRASVANVLISKVRDFAKRKGSVNEPRGLLEGARASEMHSLLEKLANEAKPLLKKESRCPNIVSPVIVIGDIHGNLEDLLTLEKTLWRSAPVMGTNFLFLGDYVDRGKWSLECAVYLLSLKVLCPWKVTLLRGNHEVRQLQVKYSYKQECTNKYGNDWGERIWKLTNELFDLLPVAATVDGRIFCTHGGLSPNAKTVDEIRKKVPWKLENPEVQSKIAWDLLWSDPCHMQQYLDIMEYSDSVGQHEYAKQGYLYNSKRGAAYLFNERAATDFLNRNHLSHIIRAHEVPPFGFQHHFNQLCTTVFSCSHYCNNDNEAAVILVDINRIRAIRIDTHNNAPATN